ncbi:hypothetical protein ACVOMT_22255 [Sphingomonas panni]
MIEVAWTHDSAPALNVANGNAYALLVSLGLDAESFGEIPLAELRRRLTESGGSTTALPPTPIRRATCPRCVAMARTKTNPPDASLAWA